MPTFGWTESQNATKISLITMCQKYDNKAKD